MSVPTRLLPAWLLLPALLGAQAHDSDDLRGRIVELAQSLVGLRYVYGGGDLDGFDCSGFVHYLYSCYGIEIPRSARDIRGEPHHVKLSEARPGDILVFQINGSWHVALLLGHERFVHAPNRRGHVREEELDDYHRQHLKAVVNVID
jgi:cell wall-associated NlpC family hydrolase